MPKIKDLITNVNTLCITGHVHPDGDCVGSVLGLYLYLKKNHPAVKAQVYVEEATNKLAFLAGFADIITDFPAHEPYDLMICLDSAGLDRIGKAEKYFKAAKRTVNIDHHVSNTMFADENYVNGDSSSASEEIYKFMEPDLIDRDIAIALYTGILYDTGVFKYRSTSSETMRIVSELMQFDIPTDTIIDESFYAKSYAENRIFGYAVLNSRLAAEGKIIYAALTQKEIQSFGVSSKELEGIVAQLRLTEGVLAALFLYETPAGDIKVSFRSIPPFTVNEIAGQFGGGGHIYAAGATIHQPLNEAVSAVLAVVEEQIKKQNL